MDNMIAYSSDVMTKNSVTSLWDISDYLGTVISTDDVSKNKSCPLDPPDARHLSAVPFWYLMIIAFYVVCVLVSLFVYFDEIYFILKHFTNEARMKTTVWILAFFPTFTITSFLSVILPRSGPLCDLVANVFFVTCLYQFLGLMTNYLGGQEKMNALLSTSSRHIKVNTPPLCCCCVCWPPVPLNQQTYRQLTYLVTQMVIIRPVLLFVAAVLWTSQLYSPGYFALDDGFLYIAVPNVVSTMLAMWGLKMINSTFRAELEERFSMTGKIRCLQVCMFSSALPYIIIGALVNSEVIRCTAVYSAKTTGAVISRGIMVVLMCLYGILARRVFRRKSDAHEDDNKTASLLLNPQP